MHTIFEVNLAIVILVYFDLCHELTKYEETSVFTNNSFNNPTGGKVPLCQTAGT